MSLTLMYITNNVDIALIAQKSGVDRIWVDMEYIGKEKRQGGLDTVKSHHTVDDVKKLRPHIFSSELMVRINPIHDATDAYCSTEEEIEQVISAGADVVMLPMFKTAEDVRFTIDRIKETETIYAYNMQYVIQVEAVDKQTVKITLSQEVPFFEYNLTFPILSRDYCSGEDFTNSIKVKNAIICGFTILSLFLFKAVK